MALKDLPPLNNRYTNPNVEIKQGGNKEQAMATGKTIERFYNDQLGADFKKVQSNANANKPNAQDEAKLAADIANLQGLERQFAKYTGDTETLKQLSDHPDATTEGVTTNQILESAGSSRQKDTDFTYASSNKDNIQQVQAQVVNGGDELKNTMGISTFGQKDGQTVAFSGSSGVGGKDWAFSSSAGTTFKGGNWDAGSAKVLVDKLAGGSGTANYGVREKTEAFAQLSGLQGTLKPEEFNNILKQPGAQQLWDTGQKYQGAKDFATNPDTYNKLYDHFNR